MRQLTSFPATSMTLFRRLLLESKSLIKPYGVRQLSNTSGATKEGKTKLAVLCILDGWGYRPIEDNNSVLLANTPNFDKLWSHCSQRGRLGFLNASELFVGLPKGQIGNSEVGHMNIGSGRVVYQDICTIDNAIQDKSIDSNDNLLQFIDKLKKTGGKCHLMGLLSPGGVHSLQSHMAALANIISSHEVPVVVHAFTDGRDVPPQDAINSLPVFEKSINGYGKNVTIGTVIGRYFAMDRDNRWERVGQAYDAIVAASGEKIKTASSPIQAIKQAYDNKVTDEFIPATVIEGYKGVDSGKDGLLMANFRADRAREILKALLFKDEVLMKELGIGNKRKQQPAFSSVLGMVKYSEEHNKLMKAIFEEKDIRRVLGEVVSEKGLWQLRIAETEKYPHVTFFFNGGREKVFEKEDRILVPSPKVATYDLQPEMSALEVGDKLCKAIDSGKYSLVIVNFANPDMVGHTGVLKASIKAVETVDQMLGKLLTSVEQQKGSIIVTADHGNCEQMWNYEINEPHTAHTLNKVPMLLADYSGKHKLQNLAVKGEGSLCDLAPTILKLLDIEQPKEMTGNSLIVK